METQNCVLPVLVAVLIVHACGWTRVTDARDDAEIMARIAALEKGQRESQTEVRALREIVAEQKNTINEQSMKLITLEQDITALKSSQHRQFKRFQRRERSHQSQREADRSNAVQTQESATNEGQAPSSQHSPDNVKNSNIRRTSTGVRAAGYSNVHPNWPKRQAPEAVAFTFYLDHDVDLGANQVIKFNKEITNEGSGYNIHTGAFTCPTAGMYLFSFAVGERDARQQWAKLMVNSQNIVDAAAEGTHQYQDLQGGNTVVVRLNQGDSVWIESYSADHLEGSDSLRITTFTGILMYP